MLPNMLDQSADLTFVHSLAAAPSLDVRDEILSPFRTSMRSAAELDQCAILDRRTSADLEPSFTILLDRTHQNRIGQMPSIFRGIDLSLPYYLAHPLDHGFP